MQEYEDNAPSSGICLYRPGIHMINLELQQLLCLQTELRSSMASKFWCTRGLLWKPFMRWGYTCVISAWHMQNAAQLAHWHNLLIRR